MTNRSSPTSWTVRPSVVRQRLPAVPVAFRHAVLDGDDRVLPRPVRPERDHLIAGEAAFTRLREHVRSRLLVVELAGGRVERDEQVASRR